MYKPTPPPPIIIKSIMYQSHLTLNYTIFSIYAQVHIYLTPQVSMYYM